MPKPEIRHISDLTPDPKNANKGTQRGRGLLESSLREFGAGRSILLDKHGRIIAGNKTVEVAADIGLDDVIVVPSDGHTLVAVQRTDLDLERDASAKRLAIADNRTAEVGLDWDPEILAEFDADGLLAGMFEKDELAGILKRTGEPREDPGAQEDKADELREKWQTARGQVWEVGRHRLMCGDSTSAEDVARLFRGGEVPTLTVTDPPYGVEYDPGWRQEAAAAGHLAYAASRVGEVPNDERVDWTDAWRLCPGPVIYCWYGMLRSGDVWDSLVRAGFEIRAECVWSKPHLPISRGHYHARHESCWYAVRKGEQAHWIGDHKQTTVWEIPLDKNVEGGHSTQKPVACMAIPIRNHEGGVYDPFVGSGTTLVAAEQNGRAGFGMDISEAYVAVALERLSQMGLIAKLTNG